MSTIPELESGAEENAAKGASRRHAEPYAGSTSGEGSAQSVADLFEQGFARIRDTHEKMSEVLEDASEALNQAFTIANRGSIEFRLKMIEMLHANLRAWQDAARHLIAAKSPSEFVEIAANQNAQAYRNRDSAGARTLRTHPESGEGDGIVDQRRLVGAIQARELAKLAKCRCCVCGKPYPS